MPLLRFENINGYTTLGIWKIQEDSHSLLNMADFSERELLWINQLKNNTIKSQKICVRLLVKKILKKNIEINYDLNDKPFLCGSSHNISITHSKNYVGVIISQNKNPGIDIEYIDNRIFKIETRFLSPAEIQNIENNRLLYLLLYWNAKEVIYKIHGKKMLNFKDEIFIHPFDIKDRGQFQGIITKKGCENSFKLHYEILEGYTMVWSLNNDL